MNWLREPNQITRKIREFRLYIILYWKHRYIMNFKALCKTWSWISMEISKPCKLIYIGEVNMTGDIMEPYYSSSILTFGFNYSHPKLLDLLVSRQPRTTIFLQQQLNTSQVQLWFKLQWLQCTTKLKQGPVNAC
jgi:hypothetical protein